MLKIVKDCIFIFYDILGYVKYYISIYDLLINGIFIGDIIGIYYREFVDVDVELYLLLMFFL